jgi:hypothetical protein
MTGAPGASVAASAARRGRRRSRIGLVLAVVALLAQIAGSGLHPAPIGSANGVGKLAIAFDARALCLVPDSTAPGAPAPADKAPKAHHDFAACCVSHGSVVAVLAPAVHVEPVAFAASHVAFTAPPADIPNRLYSAARARAPPRELNTLAA